MPKPMRKQPRGTKAEGMNVLTDIEKRAMDARAGRFVAFTPPPATEVVSIGRDRGAEIRAEISRLILIARTDPSAQKRREAQAKVSNLRQALGRLIFSELK